MVDKLRKYVDELFDGVTPTKKAVELKEGMIQNLTEKYQDLLKEDKTPEAAYNIVIAGIGDISDLLAELENDTHRPEKNAAARQKSAMLTAIAIMLYILSVIPVIILGALVGSTEASVIGVCVMFILIAAGTGLLIYNSMTKPKYIKGNDSMVDEFRQWQAGNQQKKTLRSSISGALWSIIVALYFIVSFATGAWHISWVIFVLGGAVEALINVGFTAKK